MDFEAQTLREGLENAGFHFGAAAVFSWIGVTMYLTLPAIEATLDTVAACPVGTLIVLTYNLPAPVVSGLGLGTQNVLAEIAAEMGEPFVSVLEPAAAERLMRHHGFDDVIHFGPEEAIQRHFAGRDNVRLHATQRLIVARVAGS